MSVVVTPASTLCVRSMIIPPVSSPRPSTMIEPVVISSVCWARPDANARSKSVVGPVVIVSATASPKPLTRNAPVALKLTALPKPVKDTSPLASRAKPGVPSAPVVTRTASAPLESAKLALDVSPIWPSTLVAPINNLPASTSRAVAVRTVRFSASIPASAPMYVTSNASVSASRNVTEIASRLMPGCAAIRSANAPARAPFSRPEISCSTLQSPSPIRKETDVGRASPAAINATV